ncbi:MAG: tetratricopeptide repeat protein [Prolixibacteraceae bacterium]|jgi:tetratricopeptide (TPR) repeat protein|nr:tetratricopeptide repeat protein [Prolixibacteraceae bacterium]
MKRLFIYILFTFLFAASHAQINTNHVMLTGRSRLYFGNYTGAIESFNMVINTQPHLPEPFYFRGVAKLNLEDHRGAISDLNKALEIKPFYPEAYLHRGMVNYNIGEYQKALTDYSEALKFDIENADIYNNRGICKAAMRDFEGAIEDYSKAIEYKPKNFNAYLNRSIAYQVTEQWDKAIADCNQLIRIRPNSAMGYMSRGLIKIEKKDFASALRDFDMAIYLDPNNSYAYQNRGMVKHQLESYEAAIMDYNKALEIDNQMAGAYFNRAIAKEILNIDGYQSDYNYASTLDPRYAKRPWQTREEREESAKQQLQAWQQQASNQDAADSTAANYTNEPADSVYRIDEKELQKRKMRANLVVADIRDLPGDDEPGRVQNQNINIERLPVFAISTINKSQANAETVGYFNLTIEKLNAKNNYQPYLTITNHFEINSETAGYYENQILFFNRKIEQNNTIAENYLYRAIFKYLLQKYNEAIDDFTKAIELDERNLPAYFMRANTHFKMIETIENIALSDDILLNADEKRQNNQTIESTNEAYNDIFTDYSVVLYMNPNFYFAYFNRGNMYLSNEQYYQALDEYNNAISFDKDFAEAYYNRGLVKILLGDINGGASDLSRAGELGIEKSYNVIKRYCN